MKLTTAIIILTAFSLGVLAGHFHGKAVTLERFVLVTHDAINLK